MCLRWASTLTLAIWPAPVNPDVCFESVGFTDFQDHDVEWESRASKFLRGLIAAMGKYGEARLLSKPLTQKRQLAAAAWQARSADPRGAD